MNGRLDGMHDGLQMKEESLMKEGDQGKEVRYAKCRSLLIVQIAQQCTTSNTFIIQSITLID